MDVQVNVVVHGINRVNAALTVIKKVRYLFLPLVLLLGSDFVSYVIGTILFKLFCNVEFLQGEE